MPGPVSDSYDPEFGTGYNAYLVREALEGLDRRITGVLGPGLVDIVEVAESRGAGSCTLALGEMDLRLVRFALRRALESV